MCEKGNVYSYVPAPGVAPGRLRVPWYEPRVLISTQWAVCGTRTSSVAAGQQQDGSWSLKPDPDKSYITQVCGF